MARRVSLPTLDDGRPRVDVIRRRLGGRAESERGAGEVVRFRTSGGSRGGVVLFVEGSTLEVWTELGIVHRVTRDRLEPPGEAAGELAKIAADVRGFAALTEGERVQMSTARGTEHGTLVEKCRFGGLVERADGTIVGVGFRKLAAASPAASARDSAN